MIADVVRMNDDKEESQLNKSYTVIKNKLSEML